MDIKQDLNQTDTATLIRTIGILDKGLHQETEIPTTDLNPMTLSEEGIRGIQILRD